MTPLVGPAAVVASLLAVGGAAKVVAPAPAAAALAALRLPSRPALVRALGVGELSLAAAAIAAGGNLLPALVALAYLGFAGFVYRARRSGAVASCGCFGRAGVPPTRLHLAVNLLAAFLAASGAVVGLPGIAAVLDDQPWAGVPFGGFVFLGTWLTQLALTRLPGLDLDVVHRHREVAPFTIVAPRQKAKVEA